MKALKQRSNDEGVAHHANLAVRVYAEDSVQKVRIEHSRNFLKRAIGQFSMDRWPLTIIELGCGTADISGPQSPTHNVIGMDCNEAAIKHAQMRFPSAVFTVENIESLSPVPCDILILCELLEHLSDPKKFVSEWLPKAQVAIISHPIDGDIFGDLSGGDHQWSYSDIDFDTWPILGNHKYIDSISFNMHGYNPRIGLSRRWTAKMDLDLTP